MADKYRYYCTYTAFAKWKMTLTKMRESAYKCYGACVELPILAFAYCNKACDIVVKFIDVICTFR